MFVTTKLWNSEHEYGKAVRAADESLAKLGLDHVDLYLIHWPTPQARATTSKPGTRWRRCKHDGLTRSIGVSNFTGRHLRRLEEEAGCPRGQPDRAAPDLHPEGP